MESTLCARARFVVRNIFMNLVNIFFKRHASGLPAAAHVGARNYLLFIGTKGLTIFWIYNSIGWNDHVAWTNINQVTRVTTTTTTGQTFNWETVAKCQHTSYTINQTHVRAHSSRLDRYHMLNKWTDCVFKMVVAGKNQSNRRLETIGTRFTVDWIWIIEQ